MALFNDGISIKEIVRRTGHSRGLVRQITRGLHTDVFRTRESSLEPYLQIPREVAPRFRDDVAPSFRELTAP